MMKKYIKYMASLLAVSFAMSACIDLEEMNVDPNNATTTNPSLLLTGVAIVDNISRNNLITAFKHFIGLFQFGCLPCSQDADSDFGRKQVSGL